MQFALPDRLEADPIALRPLRIEDVAAYAAAFEADRDLGRLLGFETDPDEASLRETVERQTPELGERRHAQLAIADAASDAFLGELMIHSLSDRNRRGELGFFVVPAHRGRGVAGRAVGIALDWLFGELDLLRVEITTTPDNTIVPSLAERLGFQREGLLRGRNFERGQRVDLVWFGLLREEWHGL